MTSSTATRNFDIAVEALYNAAPSERAREFVTRLASDIRDKGARWIVEHEFELHITDVDISCRPDLCPIGDNRLFYLGQWQLALAAE